jgi:hypothetical protein
MDELTKQIIIEAAKDSLTDLVLESPLLYEKLTFREHVGLLDFVSNITYEDVCSILTEDIKAFEGKFKKFLKYGLAGIVSMISGFGLTGPMFALYMFRKASDPCEQACITKYPLSRQKKICKLRCQHAATRKIIAELREEITRCNEFPNPKKCMQKLQKIYITWARRFQELTVKLRQAEAGLGEQTNLDKYATKLIENLGLSKQKILKIIEEDSFIRKSLVFKDQLLLYEAIKNVKEQQFRVDPDIAKTDEEDPTKSSNWNKVIELVLAAAATPIPIPGLTLAVLYIFRKLTDKCLRACVQQRKYSHDLCYAQCRYNSSKKAVQILEMNLKKCVRDEKPKKCYKQVFRLLEKWKQDEAEFKIKYETALASEKAKFEEAKRKEQEKAQGQQ